MSTIVFADTETAGLTLAHPIIQLAGIAVDIPEWSERECFEIKLRFDEKAADPAALRLNHFDAALWARAAVEPAVAVQRFKVFLDKYRTVEMVSIKSGAKYSVTRIAGHNLCGFDLDRLSKLFADNGKTFFPVHFMSALDTLHGARWFCERSGDKPKSYKLTDIAEHFGIPTDGAHDALADCRLSIALARRFLS